MIKLTPKNTIQLSEFLEMQIEQHGTEPMSDTIAWWIADWVKEKMEDEAYTYAAKVKNGN